MRRWKRITHWALWHPLGQVGGECLCAHSCRGDKEHAQQKKGRVGVCNISQETFASGNTGEEGARLFSL